MGVADVFLIVNRGGVFDGSFISKVDLIFFFVCKVLEDFEELDRAYQKSKKVIEAEGFPRFVVRCLADLEDFVAELWEDKEARKKMSKLNSKGLFH